MKMNCWSNLWRIGLGCALVISYSIWGKAAIQLLFALTQGFEISPEGN
ncbi:MAG: hypothetical protein O3A87_00515 [Verrucomicrobia bacterium]|nr:hypothetical protein [Verrucomicrobiota bacterium]MDA1004951.1 hypothetical protein [Verrucomicrobiota bacterium]